MPDLLLLEGGGYLLQEDGVGRIVLEANSAVTTAYFERVQITVGLSNLGTQGASCSVLGRLLKEDPATLNMVPCVPADIATIQRWVISLLDGVTVLSGPTNLTVSSTILSSLSTGTVWRRDSVGYNFTDSVAGALLTDPIGVELQYAVTLSGGPVVKLNLDVNLRMSN